ncbi:uncharacterized protein CTRU02_203022 [Colletotrichum truncatum]|uniref:Uncharacterized protein n=1 Tax=Colletotrichum truncatum TaxID=5467 RepID=A0ACC3Z830_COLTU|nr:uncharacterized protein CTRU02_13157 [Colletotrichum truncatum]KAF6783649.1 hypothetical protein CTRU02_13157 [Colletotrichum truncatum]
MVESVEDGSDEEKDLTSPPLEGFGPEASRSFLRLFRDTTIHKVGDTAFHITARTGCLNIINASWRAFFCVENRGQPSNESGFDTSPLLLARKNAAGRTAANEAVAAGHDHVAEWLSPVLNRLTLGGKRATESRMARMEELVDCRYDIDGQYIKADQVPVIRRKWMMIESSGTVRTGNC